MFRLFLSLALIGASLLTATSRVYADVQLSEAARTNLGIATTAASFIQVPRQWQGSAQVIDAAPLLTALSDLRSAQVLALASTAELQRLDALYKADNAALKSVEAARAQAIADQGKVSALRAQLLGSWGMALLRVNDHEHEQLTQRLLSGRTVLIKVELIEKLPRTSNVQMAHLQLDDGTSLPAKLLGAMPLINSQAMGKAYLLSVSVDDNDLQPGETFNVTMQDASRSISGVGVSRAAIVRWQGQQWAYVQRGASHYERVALKITQWTAQGALLIDGVKAGDRVVTTGAGLLLGAEFSPAAEKE